MRRLVALLALLFLLLPTIPTNATVRIVNDRGGRIGDYAKKYQSIQNSGESVVIDGMCASACTLVLALPRKQICATPRAWLGFHQAYNFGIAKSGTRIVVADAEASNALYHAYPVKIRDWIFLKGGLPEPRKMLRLSGQTLTHFVSPCRTIRSLNSFAHTIY